MIMEVGGGAGALGLRLARALPASVLAVEADAERSALYRARSAWLGLGDRLSVCQARLDVKMLLELRMGNNAFDALVMLAGVLEQLGVRSRSELVAVLRTLLGLTRALILEIPRECTALWCDRTGVTRCRPSPRPCAW